MKLATIKSSKNIDGDLVVVSRDNKWATLATHIVPNMRTALEKWHIVKLELESLYAELNAAHANVAKFEVRDDQMLSALPRTFLFADGSAFIQHIKLVRMARKAPLPETLNTVPLMYQGEGTFLAPTQKIPKFDSSFGVDFEGEVGVITDFVPMGVSVEEALQHICLVVLINDVSLRGLIPAELAQGFGFFQSKPASALSPFAVTVDELEDAWVDGRIHLPLQVQLNGKKFGEANAGEMHFHFGQLISHAAKTRDLPAGTLIGSGTVSNEDTKKGCSCLAEKRMLEQISGGEIKTPFMQSGDTIEIAMVSKSGHDLFGHIKQTLS